MLLYRNLNLLKLLNLNNFIKKGDNERALKYIDSFKGRNSTFRKFRTKKDGKDMLSKG